MDLDFAHRVALVVGGTGFIGSAVAERLRAEGATVVVASRSAEEGVALDASDEESVRRAIATVLERHGRIDALVVGLRVDRRFARISRGRRTRDDRRDHEKREREQRDGAAAKARRTTDDDFRLTRAHVRIPLRGEPKSAPNVEAGARG